MIEEAAKKTIGKMLSKFVPKIFEGINKKYKISKLQQDIDLRVIFQEYLEYSYTKYITVKTLLYKNEGKNLYDFYEPQVVKSPDASIDLTNTDFLFNKCKRIIITGTGGIGKSMLMKHIFINQISNESSIPIFIELKSMNNINIEDFEIKDFIYGEMNRHHFKLSRDLFYRSLEFGIYTIIFDGVDEINLLFRETIIGSLKKFIDIYNNNRYVLSSRPSEEYIGWNDFIEYSVQPLNKKQALSLIGRLDYDSITKKQFSKELNDSLYDNHESFASIPLLLTIMLMTYESGASIPNNLTDFYTQAFYTLYHKHDASKSGYKRELRADLSPETFKEILSYLAMKTFIKKQVNFSPENVYKIFESYKNKYFKKFEDDAFIFDAISNICMLVQDGEFRFTHRSFQEYFAGIGVSKLDDNKQKMILQAWLDNDYNNINYNRTFIMTLLTVQQERTYLNLFVPIIENLKNNFQELNTLDDKINFCFKTFYLNPEVGITFILKEKFEPFFQMFFILLENIGIPLTDIDDRNFDDDIIKGKIEYPANDAKFEDLADSEKELLRSWVDSWLIRRYDYAIKWADEVLRQSITNKTTIDSLIDEL